MLFDESNLKLLIELYSVNKRNILRSCDGVHHDLFQDKLGSRRFLKMVEETPEWFIFFGEHHLWSIPIPILISLH